MKVLILIYLLNVKCCDLNPFTVIYGKLRYIGRPMRKLMNRTTDSF